MSIDIREGDCVAILPTLPAESVDLTVTSPPYDDLRSYQGSLSDWNPAKWRAVIRELHRVTKPGGVVVWVVGDATDNGSETGTSFRQALYAKRRGFRLHDTMIWNKGSFSSVGDLASRYAPVFEYMFVWSKGAPKTFNPIKDRPNKWAGTALHGTVRNPDGTMKAASCIGRAIPEHGQRFNIWDITPEKANRTGHPAPFPGAIPRDHILTWSNPGDTVLDPFLGSGTTGRMAADLGRAFIGIEREPTYAAIARDQIASRAGLFAWSAE